MKLLLNFYDVSTNQLGDKNYRNCLSKTVTMKSTKTQCHVFYADMPCFCRPSHISIAVDTVCTA